MNVTEGKTAPPPEIVSQRGCHFTVAAGHIVDRG